MAPLYREDSPLLGPSAAEAAGTAERASSTSSSIRKPSSEADEAGSTTSQPEFGNIEDDVLPEESVLGRNIDWKSAYIIAISRVIGSGIFAVPGVILTSVGSVGLSLSLWVLGAVVVACGLAVSLEYGCMLPRSGGDKVYLEFTYPRPRFFASTMIAVQAVLLGFTASNCIIFSQYVHFVFDVETRDFSKKALAVGLITVITIIHGCWYRAGIRIQNFLGWIKVGLVLFMVLAALYVVLFRPEQEGLGNERVGIRDWDGLWEGSDWNLGTIATSLFKVFYSYAGLSNLNNVMNEVKDPVRTLKSVSLTALVTACFLYLLANLAYFAVVPVDEIKQSGQLVAALFFERTFGPNVGKRFLPLAVALSAAGNVMVVTFAVARLNQEIARAGFLPYARYLSSSKPFNAPMGGLIVHYIPSVLVIALPPSSEVYSFILEVEGYPGQVFALATSIGLIWLRYKRPELKRPFKAWIPAVIFRSLLCLALLAAPFFPPSHPKPGGLFYATYAIVGVGILVFGVVYWLVWTVILPRLGRYRLEEKPDVLDDGTAITVLTRPETYERPTSAHKVHITDVSGREAEFTLDGNGFQYYRHTAQEKDFADDDHIKAVYYPETEQLLKDVTGASKIFIFDHTIRRNPADQRAAADRSRALRGPVNRVHIDQTYSAALSRVPHHLPAEEAAELLKGRVQIINVWRPIRQVLRDPLAIADASSVGEEELVAIPLIYPNRRGETFAVRHTPAHRWYYKYGLDTDEVLLIKCFDSKTDGRARRVPHTAFADPNTPDGTPSRQSIEIRALVFHPDDRD
ncbi:amino acid permease-domain-containing protein [Durotheca rogersii]|uniref:amino acid permease-domain-containing protein n=1 Tax=Durotheca rogersii TaxID=419775 RepID=UPI002220EE39|nr:amino acid permease-domain-containing protein [Durotheca rogersii]KAI5867556.1 amino acid permease-domain-containing protein [Durotheca rogersii]